MRNNPGGELGRADDVRKSCVKIDLVLSCIGKRTKEGWTVKSGESSQRARWERGTVKLLHQRLAAS